jgi:hypothetical protein
MAHYLTSDGKYRGMPFGEDVWSYPSGHLFGTSHMNRGRAASNHASRYLRKVVDRCREAAPAATRGRTLRRWRSQRVGLRQ